MIIEKENIFMLLKLPIHFTCSTKVLFDFWSGELEELIKHGLRALRDTLPNEVDLTTKVSTVDLLSLSWLSHSSFQVKH